jgi:hypothetical protein
MKKIFTILALLAFLMVPAASMAMVQTTDADLATITGAGVSIDITSLQIGVSMDSISWGDYNVNGFTANGVTYNQGGNINIIPLSGSMHVQVGGITAGTLVTGTALSTSAYDTYTPTDLIVNINVGTVGGTNKVATTGQNYTVGGTTAIQLGFANGIAIKMDGFVADIVLDSYCAAYNDWKYEATGYVAGELDIYNKNAGFNNIKSDGTMDQTTGKGTLAAKTLGTFGVSGVNLNIQPFSVTISAH